MSSHSDLEPIGFSPRWQALFAPFAEEGLLPARVIRADRGSVLAATGDGVVRAEPSTRLLKRARGAADLPAAGDWVALFAPPDLDVAQVEAVLDRSSAFMRGDPGTTSDAQVLAANIDTVFVVHPIPGDPNLRRIERELALAWDSGAVPVVVLTKADLSPDPEGAVAAVEAVALGVDVHLTSAATGEGVDALGAYTGGARTVALIGPSGAGKSTLINSLLGEERQATREVRVVDGKGRHVTVARELIAMPGGGVLVDTPGLRALALTDAEEGIAAAFPDIERFAESCRFRDCMHAEEPGCAVTAAVESGELAEGRLMSWHKLRREAEVAAMKTDARLRAEEVRKWKIILKSAKDFKKRTGRG
ncbi:MAG: ribosome small subunit-dependent GTPase A [Actinomycetota bacterium]|nr:ribosome small subunit-dependent GTPase A [Actinomycetota bacterium]